LPGGFSTILVLKRASVSVIWGDDPEMRLGLPVYGCALDDIQAEAEKAMCELSDVSAKIAVTMPK